MENNNSNATNIYPTLLKFPYLAAVLEKMENKNKPLPSCNIFKKMNIQKKGKESSKEEDIKIKEKDQKNKIVDPPEIIDAIEENDAEYDAINIIKVNEGKNNNITNEIKEESINEIKEKSNKGEKEDKNNNNVKRGKKL